MQRISQILLATVLLTLMCMNLQAAENTVSTEDLLNTTVDTVEGHDTPIEDLLRLLAAQINLNLVIGPDSMGTVSLRFAGVTVREALDAILQAKGFQYQIYGNIMMISRPDSLEKIRGLGLQTRMFRLKYADARDIKATIDTSRVLSPWGQTTVYYQTINTGAVKAGYIKPSMELVSRERLDLEDPVPAGKTPLQARSNLLIVTDRPPNLKRVAEMIDIFDQPSRQVEIDVQFVETILSDDQQLGVDWSQILKVKGAYQGRTNWVFGESVSDLIGGLVPGDGSSGAATTETEDKGGKIELGSLTSSSFQAVLDMMIKEEKARLLSQPRITTIENQPATISVGVTTWIEERSGGGGGTEVQITYNERQVPIELVVVPHIIDSERIMLELRPRVEEITGWQEGYGGLQLPLISTRVSDSRVEVGDNETAVIGGLIKEKSLSTDKRVWLLGSLPLIGNLFRHQVESKERTELTIFITPRIIKPGQPHGKPDKELMESRRRDESDDTPASEDGEDLKGAKRTPERIKNAETELTSGSLSSVDMMRYFPIGTGESWSYSWHDDNGERWKSRLAVVDDGEGIVRMTELIPEGSNKSAARSGYRWSDQGMLNLYRVNDSGDSMSYDPPRIILPDKMVVGKVYKNRYGWRKWSGGRRLQSGEVMQRQRLIGHFTVSTELGRFKNCAAVETISCALVDGEESNQKRKVIWYAEGVGPVKVEGDIPLDNYSLEGTLSALLTKR